MRERVRRPVSHLLTYLVVVNRHYFRDKNKSGHVVINLDYSYLYIKK